MTLRALSMKFKTTHAPPGDTLVHQVQHPHRHPRHILGQKDVKLFWAITLKRSQIVDVLAEKVSVIDFI